MQLSKIIKNLNREYKSHKFSNISFNSKNCKKEDIFVAVKGKKKMEIYTLMKQLKMELEQLFLI